MKRTPGQIETWRSVAELEQTQDAKASNLDHLRKLETAAAEQGFSGTLRRAIDLDLCRRRQSPHRMAAAVGIDVLLLEDFRAGDAVLPSDVIDRLVDLLRLRLMADVL